MVSQQLSLFLQHESQFIHVQATQACKQVESDKLEQWPPWFSERDETGGLGLHSPFGTDWTLEW